MKNTCCSNIGMNYNFIQGHCVVLVVIILELVAVAGDYKGTRQNPRKRNLLLFALSKWLVHVFTNFSFYVQFFDKVNEYIVFVLNVAIANKL